MDIVQTKLVIFHPAFTKDVLNMKILFIKRSLVVILMVILAGSCTQQKQEGISIIPMPEKLETTSASFTITSETRILAEQGNAEALRIANL